MHQVNRIGALFLLAIFMVGGMVAPQVHQIQHAHELHAHEQATVDGTGHTHSDLPAVSTAPQSYVHLEVGCFLCSGLSAWEVQEHVSIIPGRLIWTINDVPGALSLPLVSLYCPVRGPPLA